MVYNVHVWGCEESTVREVFSWRSVVGEGRSDRSQNERGEDLDAVMGDASCF